MKTNLLICFLGLSCIVNAQWENIYTFPTFNYPLSLITVNNDLYAGTSGDGVLKSQDYGETWLPSNNGIFLGSAYVFSLTSRNDSIYAGGFGEVSFSNNGATNWSLLNLNLSLNNRVYALVVKDNYLFAGVGNDNSSGVYRKEVSGFEWTLINNGLPENVGAYAFLMVDNSLFVGTQFGVYKSIDNGNNWISANEGLHDSLLINALYLINGNILAGTPEGIYISSDQGMTWNVATGLPVNTTVTCFNSINNIVVAGSYSGAFLSADDGLTWSDFNDGFGDFSFVYSITSLGDYFYAGTGQGIFKIMTTSPTSVLNEAEPDNSWLTYPNPFSSQTVLEFKNPVRNATLTVYNLYGQRLKQINNLSGESIIIQRDNLSTGIYFMELRQEGKVIATDKIIITDN